MGIEYELKNGTFTYNSDIGGNIEAKYFYSDGYFAQSPTVYNEHLATTSVNMTLASATSDLGERPYKSVAIPAGQMAVTVTPLSLTSFEKATEKLFRYALLAL